MDEFKRDLEDYFCRFTFGQFVTLILLEILTLFFVFYLGARYGPDLMGGRESAIAQDHPVLPREGAGSVDEIVGSPPVDYTYPEILTGPEGKRAMKIKPSGVTAEEFEDQKKSPKVVVTPAEPAVPAVVLESETPMGKYAIQVGSYPTAAEASSVVGQWKGKGYTAFMSVGQIPQRGTWYRVRIGGFPTREEAEVFLEKLKTKEKTTGLVVLSSS